MIQLALGFGPTIVGERLFIPHGASTIIGVKVRRRQRLEVPDWSKRVPFFSARMFVVPRLRRGESADYGAVIALAEEAQRSAKRDASVNMTLELGDWDGDRPGPRTPVAQLYFQPKERADLDRWGVPLLDLAKDVSRLPCVKAVVFEFLRDLRRLKSYRYPEGKRDTR